MPMFHADILTVFVQQIKPIASVIMLLTAIHKPYTMHVSISHMSMITWLNLEQYFYIPDTSLKLKLLEPIPPVKLQGTK